MQLTPLSLLDARRERGFLLLEAILAVSILSVIAVSLTVAIDRLGAVATQSQREMAMMRNLETLLTWHLRDPNIEERREESAPDAYGVIYQSEVPEIELFNVDGEALPEMLRISIRAVWQEASGMQEQTVETYRYARLYRTTQ
jgi:hypothetical protein